LDFLSSSLSNEPGGTFTFSNGGLRSYGYRNAGLIDFPGGTWRFPFPNDAVASKWNPIDNTGGIIRFSNNATVSLRGSWIRGGNIRLDGNVQFQATRSETVAGSISDAAAFADLIGYDNLLENVTIDGGQLSLTSGKNMIRGSLTLTNGGSLDVGASRLILDAGEGGVSIAGQGAVRVAGYGETSQSQVVIRGAGAAVFDTAISLETTGGSTVFGSPDPASTPSSLVVRGPWRVNHWSSSNRTLIGAESFVHTGVLTQDLGVLDAGRRVRSVSVPSDLFVGDPVTVAYEVTNNQTARTDRQRWVDAVYLSRDQRWDASDTLLGTVSRQGPLAAGGVYAASASCLIQPGALGTGFIIVRPGLASVGSASDQRITGTKGAAASPQVTVSIRRLDAGTPQDSASSPADSFDVYELSLASRRVASLSVSTIDGRQRPDVLVGYGRIPTPASHDLRIPAGAGSTSVFVGGNHGDQRIYIRPDSTRAGGSRAVRLLATVTMPQITGVSPAIAPARGPVTFTIDGLGLASDSVVELVMPDGSTRTAEAVTSASDRRLTARFSMDGAGGGAGAASVRVRTRGEVVERPAAVQVRDGADGQLRLEVDAPARMAANRSGTVWIEFENVGATPVIAPMIKVTSDQPVMLTTDERLAARGFNARDASRVPPGVNTTVIAWPSGSGATPGLVQPGERGRVPVYFLGAIGDVSSERALNFRASVVTANDTTALDVTALRDASRPEWIGEREWSVMFTRFAAQIIRPGSGRSSPSWGDLVNARAELLDLAASHGERIDGLSIANLIYTMVGRSSELVASAVEVGSLDAQVDGPGPSLTFERLHDSSVPGRLREGPLGLAWTHNWDLSLREVPSQAGMLILSRGGQQRLFFRDPTAHSTYRNPFNPSLVIREQGTARALEEGSLQHTFTQTAPGSWRFDRTADRLGRTVAATYDGSGRLVRVARSSGGELRIEHASFGDKTRISRVIESIRDGEGPDDRITTFAYNADGSLLAEAILPGNRRFRYEYAASTSDLTLGALTATVLPDGERTAYSYDGLGRVNAVTRPGGHRTSIATDSMRGLVMTDPSGQSSTFIIGLDSQASSARRGEARISFIRSPDGALIGAETNAGDRSTAEYDSQGRPSRLIDPAGGATTLTYDPRTGQLRSHIDANGNETLYSLDHRGFLTTIRRADGGEESATLNSDGQVIRERRADGRQINYTYTNDGFLESIDLSDTPGLDGLFTYDDAGNMIRADEASAGVTTMTYDPATRWLTRIRYGDGRGFDFEHDLLGRRRARIDHAGVRQEYEYGTDGLLARVFEGSGAARVRLAEYRHDALGRLVEQTNADGTRSTTQYTEGGLVRRVRNDRTADASLLSEFEYAYDLAGRMTMRTTRDASGLKVETFEYDDAGRLLRESVDGAERAAYAYDAAGNRSQVRRAGASTTHEAGPLNEYRRVGAATLEHLNGYTTRDERGGVYSYDALGRMTSATVDGRTTTYTYSIVAGRIGAVTDGVAERYVIDPGSGGRPALVYNAAGALTAAYDTGLGLLSRRDGAGNRAFYHFDSNGNTTELTGDGGAVLTSYRYDAFGRFEREGDRNNPFQFTGRYGGTAQPGGLVHMGARSYSPTLGRFTGPDPLELQGGSSNFYTYAANAPLQFADPSGLIPVPAIWAIGAFVGATVNVGLTIAFSTEPLTGGAILGAVVDGAIGGFTSVAAPGLGAGGVATVNFLSGFYGEVAKSWWDGEGGSRGDLIAAGGKSLAFGWAGKKLSDGLFGRAPWTLGDLASDPRIVWDDAMKALAEREARESIGLDEIYEKLLDVLTLPLRTRLEGELVDEVDDEDGPDGENEATGFSRLVRSVDPNDKMSSGLAVNPADPYSTRIVRAGQAIDYRVRFENLSEADAAALGIAVSPVQRIEIVDRLPASLDAGTIEITEVALGRLAGADNLKVVIPVPTNGGSFASTVRVSVDHHTNGSVREIDVRVTASIETVEGEARPLLRIVIEAIDPLTGWVPQDPDVGLMRPNVEDTPENNADAATQAQIGRGEGHIAFRIRPVAGLADGTLIENVAEIRFDENEWIRTEGDDPATPGVTEARPPTRTIIDGAVPAAIVTAAAQPDRAAPSVLVTWTASDTGAGLSAVRLYARPSGGVWSLWKTIPTAGVAASGAESWAGSFGQRYEFAAVAEDAAGNAETFADVAERDILVLSNRLPTIAPAATLSIGQAGKATDLTYERLVGVMNVADADGDAIGLRIDSVPSGGVLLLNGLPVTPGVSVLSPRGTLRWTPAKKGPPSISVVFRAVTAQGESANPSSLSVNLRARNAAPSLAKPAVLALADADRDFAIELGGLFGLARDADGDALSFSIDKLPKAGTLFLNGAPARAGDRLLPTDRLVFRPGASQAKDVDAFSFKASDGSAASGSQSVKVRVNAAPTVATQAKMKPLSLGIESRPSTITFKQLVGALDVKDANKDAVSLLLDAVGDGTLTINGQPVTPGQTVITAANTLVFTPNAAGTRPILTVRAWDGRLESPARTVFGKVVANAAPMLKDQASIRPISNARVGQDFIITHSQLVNALGAKDANKDAIILRIESLGDASLSIDGQPVVAGQSILTPRGSIRFRSAVAGEVTAFSLTAFDGFLRSEGRTISVNVR
jgi:RHS repeat-associated protein